MSVLIKGMEMPKSCSDCPMLDWDLDYIKCKVTGRHFKVKEEPFGARRVDDCPLVPVQPHGRLGDLDELEVKHMKVSGDYCHGYYKSTWDYVCAARELIKDSPTIIPASFENPTKNARYSQDNPAEEGE